MSTQTNKPTGNGSGFAFGVALGALAGTAAMVLVGGKNVNKIRKQIRKDLKDKLELLKTKYPDHVEQLETIVAEALSEAKKSQGELKKLTKSASKKAKATEKDIQKRVFKRSGKTVKDPQQA